MANDISFTLTGGKRVRHMDSEKTYGDIWMVSAPDPVLIEHKGATWRLDQVLRTDTEYVWVTFVKQTKSGRDFARGGDMTILLESSTDDRYSSVRSGDPHLADALHAQLAVATVDPQEVI
jgi:hypothetical protein